MEKIIRAVEESNGDTDASKEFKNDKTIAHNFKELLKAAR